jgi:hypothetical protein
MIKRAGLSELELRAHAGKNRVDFVQRRRADPLQLEAVSELVWGSGT